MALIILEGLDRTGKSSVAQFFAQNGFEIVHMSAPDKALSQPGYTGPSYLDQMVEMLTSFSGKDVILDRSHYGEMVWPQIYKRTPQLNEQDMDILREIEETLDATRILMIDKDAEAHWKRCVENNEPLDKVQFVKARAAFSAMADKYGFERKTLKDFPDAIQPLPTQDQSARNDPATRSDSETTDPAKQAGSDRANSGLNKSKEQLKLERANVINEVLSKRIIKGKGQAYDEIERSIRHFLNGELGKILGAPQQAVPGFTNEEVELLRFFVKRLKEKET